jgi:uncharacterized membrane protein
VARSSARGHSEPLHPLHAIFLAFPFPLFLGALLSDLAYRSSFQVQWINFASWLIAGGLLVGALALLWALVGVLSGARTRKGRPLVYLLALLAMWAFGFIDALVHGKDAWAAMPAGLYLSALVSLLALVAAWVGYSGFHVEEPK